MILCNLEPGLLVLDGLMPYQTAEAFAILKALIVHKNATQALGAKIPVTPGYVQHVTAQLDRIPFSNPPIRKPLKEYILDMLARQVNPALAPAGVDDVVLHPDIVSPWISADIRELWLDCFAAAIYHSNVEDLDARVITATWDRSDLPLDVELRSDQLGEYSGLASNRWLSPLVVHDCDWRAVVFDGKDWPNGLEKALVEAYGRRCLRIEPAELDRHRAVLFEPACLHDIAKEADSTLRQAVVEVIACRAYNRLRPDQNDETIRGQEGIRRVYVKKMEPVVRLHYYLTKDSVVFTLYSNGDHDRGLKA